MITELKKVVDEREIYDYMEKLSFPYHYEVDYDIWKKSYLHDVDGEGRALFSDLTTLGAYADSKLVGFVQYGKTAFGFDDEGEVSDSVSCPVIRNFYYDETPKEIGIELLQAARKSLAGISGPVYAFFHYFGMSCYARHGKLYEAFGYIHDLLTQRGFAVEHENVFYSSVIDSVESSSIDIHWHNATPGGQQYCDFIMGKEIVGGCEIHFLEQADLAYLRWIFINENLCGKGIGSECMSALKKELFHKGIRRLDTDTALTNTVAQHYYEKNHFTREGITRSYHTEG